MNHGSLQADLKGRSGGAEPPPRKLIFCCRIDSIPCITQLSSGAAQADLKPRKGLMQDVVFFKVGGAVQSNLRVNYCCAAPAATKKSSADLARLLPLCN